MLTLEKQILVTLENLRETTREVTALLETNDTDDPDRLTEQFELAQDKLESRNELLDQFEAQSLELQNLDDEKRSQLKAGSKFQEQYEALLKLDSEMQDAIQSHLKRVEQQTRTNKKERDVNDKYADQRSGSVDKSLFITSKLEG